MRNIVFIAPFPMRATLRFAEALSTLDGIRLIGVFQSPPHDVDLFDDICLVDQALDSRQLIQAIHRIQRTRGPVSRVVGILEALQVPIAEVRAHFGFPGEKPDVAERFRDKGRMKDALREAGLPSAGHLRLTEPGPAWEFVQTFGFPVILKPAAGSGCKATYRITNASELRAALIAVRPSEQRPALLEEFLTGREFSFETLTVGGVPRFFSINHYHPTPLAVMENPKLQWVVTTPTSTDGLEKAIEVGLQTVTRLGLEDGMTHMEWFLKPDGTVAIGEIAMRPPGAQFVQLLSVATGHDMHRAWARAVVDQAFDGPIEQKLAVGAAYLRGAGPGRRVRAVTGLQDALLRMDARVAASSLPRIGAPRSSSYEGDGWFILEHEDDQALRRSLRTLVSSVRVHYGP